MHLWRWALVLLVAAPNATPRRELVRLKGRVDVAVAFSGRSLLWSPVRRPTDTPVLYRLEGRASRLTWRSPAVPVPPGQRAGSQVVFRVSLAASASIAAFVRETTLTRPGGFNCQDCVEPLFSELFVGPARGPLRLVEGRAQPLADDPSQHWVQSAAVTGSSVVFAENIGTSWYTPSSRVVLLATGRRAIVANSRHMNFRDVKAAGHYVAWIRQPDSCGAPEPPCRSAGVTVFDLRSNRVSYRVTENQLRSAGPPSTFALGPDGRIALLVQRPDVQVAWASPRSPRLHVLPIDAGVSDAVPIATNETRIVFVRVGAQGALNALLATDLRGRSIRLDAFRQPRDIGTQLALDGRRVAWVVQTKDATTALEARLP